MASSGMHLLKPNGKTACGMRNARLAGNYAQFMADGNERCERCASSKQAEFMARQALDAQNAPIKSGWAVKFGG